MADANTPAGSAPAVTPPAPTPKSRGPVPRARNPGLRGKCWWLMRELGAFTINRLLDTYADGTEKDAHNNLRHYLLQLEAVGVVERLERRLPGNYSASGSGRNGYVGWRLKRNLGILAPVWRDQQKVLWDPNRREIVTPVISETPQQDGPVHPSETDFHD
jgi:hypothetical protein